MGLREQVDRFSKRGAVLRQQVYGTPFTYGGKSFLGSFTAITSSRELESGGWKQDVQTLVRVARCANAAFTPADGGILILTETGARFRITQIKNNPRAPEWVFGCVSPEN